MIITKTPYRISFFGGGTDYPEWFQENGGAVLATTICHYCYIHGNSLLESQKRRRNFGTTLNNGRNSRTFIIKISRSQS